MAATVITPEDLQSFKLELLEEIKKLLSQRQTTPVRKWLKSHELRRLLTISPGTLQHLRAKATLPFTKIGGVIYYDYEDIEKMLRETRTTVLSQAEKITLGEMFKSFDQILQSNLDSVDSGLAAGAKAKADFAICVKHIKYNLKQVKYGPDTIFPVSARCIFVHKNDPHSFGRSENGKASELGFPEPTDF